MLGSSLASTLSTFDSATCSHYSVHRDAFNRKCRKVYHIWKTNPITTFSHPDLEPYSTNPISFNPKSSYICPPSNTKQLFTTKKTASTTWKTRSSGNTPETVLSEEDMNSWQACKQALSAFKFTVEEEDKILGKAFGLVHSPYWGEEREKTVPKFEKVGAILDYLRGLGLSDDDISKLLKKFPEVVGCSLEDELKTNVGILEKQWGIKGKSLKNVLLRNPKVLGYSVDCKGDCMALCTRCWVRF